MKNKILEAYDVEYNSLSKTLKMTLVLDEAAIKEVLNTSLEVIDTPEKVSQQVLELLERSIHLNLPRPRTTQTGMK